MLFALLVAISIPLSFSCWFFYYLSAWYYGLNEEAPLVSPWRWAFASLLPIFISVWGYRRHSLDVSGAIAGFFVGFVMTVSNLCFCMSLLAFFILGSKVTQFRRHRKRKLEVDFKEGGQRNWIQVMCNGGIAAQLAVIYILEVGCRETLVNFSKNYTGSSVAMATLAALSCSSGDTWSSEIGSVIGSGEPRLITTFRRVPRGTNGAVSLAGLISSVLGGLVVGVAYYVSLLTIFSAPVLTSSPPQWPIMICAAVFGLVGSIIDSLLGATVQYSGYCKKRSCVVESGGLDVEHISGMAILDNHSVNILSALLTAYVSPHIAFILWGLV